MLEAGRSEAWLQILTFSREVILQAGFLTLRAASALETCLRSSWAWPQRVRKEPQALSWTLEPNCLRMSPTSAIYLLGVTLGKCLNLSVHQFLRLKWR